VRYMARRKSNMWRNNMAFFALVLPGLLSMGG
jgi:hypothetical protein